ncbi:VTT domain-containing protein [Pseudooceanicola sp. CBS1P-1]|uniref:VTT domain-containing protein n=1 Tax=Pseudooceanicola albus TaxID=2692189 RepID=A0A6L7G6M5_9RHOB|nr:MULTISPECIES: VTT domain-containing protein [Pseudooceanicola]MBT9382980.1 VTT domain-containing protein [Pseudooceanicola endophyticus]MXN19168.1 hypothetical protein [Pseudooceanicola albus]
MFGLESIVALMSAKGLWIVAPIAVIEGPIVTVIAAWLASRGVFDPVSLTLVVIAADLFGDGLMYALGRWGLGHVPPKLRLKFGLNRARLTQLAKHFEVKGGRTLIIGKITHSAGFLVLVSAGLAKMPVAQFLWYNLIATVPKSLAFVVLGYTLGSAYTKIDGWIGKGSLIMAGVLGVVAITWVIRRGMHRKCN